MADSVGDLPMNGLAWECLRCNRGYKEDIHKLVEADADERRDGLREHWGLQFRRASEPIRVRRAGALVCELRRLSEAQAPAAARRRLRTWRCADDQTCWVVALHAVTASQR